LARLGDHTIAIFLAKKSKRRLDENKIPAEKEQTTLKGKKSNEKNKQATQQVMLHEQCTFFLFTNWLLFFM
jgi:hypothetical protein